MKLRIVAVCVCILPLFAVAQEPLPRPQEHPKPIHGQGCVEAGVENNCLLARDFKTGRLYNLIIKGLAPPVGMGIDFTGHPHRGPSTCMQGIAIDVESWARNRTLKCPRHPHRQK